MKNFTLKRSVLALIAALAMVLPSEAAVESVADLFGTYKFTSTMTVTEAGQSLKDKFSAECEVVITSDTYGVYDGEIRGLAGSTKDYQKINGIDTKANTIKITNPNGNGLWDGGLYMSNTDGIYPFGGAYNDILYTFDPQTKTITLPDFTLVTCDHPNSKATVIATFTNAKLTLVQSENVEVADLSGDWHFTAGNGTYDTMEGSTYPKEFDMTLTATDDSKKAYSMVFSLAGFEPLTLQAKFDGVTLTIPFDNTYLDNTNKIRFCTTYGAARQGDITFNMINESTLSLTSGITFCQDSISVENKGGYMQWYMSGSAKKQGGEEVKTTWDGVYKVKVGSTYVNNEAYPVPTEFDMEVKYFEDWGIYLITKFMGNDVSGLNNGGINFYPSEDDPNTAEIKTGGFLQTIEAGKKYLCLKDMNLSNGNLVVTRQEDGSYKISDFSVTYMEYDENYTQSHSLATFCQTVTATKEDVKEEEPFNWVNKFTVKANVTAYDGNTYPETFEMEVQYFENWGMYLVTKFWGNDVTGLNQGGIVFTPSTDDPKKAEMKTDALIGTIEAGSKYYKMLDQNAQPLPLTLTVNEDGTVSITSFCVSIYDWNTKQAQPVALYTNVVASVGAAVEPEPEPEPFNWTGTFAVKAEKVSIYNDAYTYPKEFDMEVVYYEASDMYLVTKFCGRDVAGVNYGGILLTPSADDPNKAELKTGVYLQTIEGGKTYLMLHDMNMGTSNLTLTVKEDGTISISDFCVSLADYVTNETKVAALYSGVTAAAGSTGIDAVQGTSSSLRVADGTIYVDGDAQNVEVYDFSGRKMFGNVTKQVSGLSKGMYLVKVAGKVVKVAIK